MLDTFLASSSFTSNFLSLQVHVARRIRMCDLWDKGRKGHSEEKGISNLPPLRFLPLCNIPETKPIQKSWKDWNGYRERITAILKQIGLQRPGSFEQSNQQSAHRISRCRFRDNTLCCSQCGRPTLYVLNVYCQIAYIILHGLKCMRHLRYSRSCTIYFKMCTTSPKQRLLQMCMT